MISGIKFKATEVFQETWQAINDTVINETTGLSERKWKIIEQVGGTRSSKTWSDLQCIFCWGYNNPYEEIVVMRDTAVDCRDKVESEWVKWIRDPNCRVIEFQEGKITGEQLNEFLGQESLLKYFVNNQTRHSWTFKHNKTSITFTGTDDADRSIGKTQSVLWVNEPYKFSEEVFLQLTQRTSQFILVDWNPKDDHFIERARSRSDTITLRSTLLNNPFCPVQTKKQVLGYQPISLCSVVVSKHIEEQDAYLYDTDKNPLNFNLKELNELKRCIKNRNEKTESYYHWKVYGLGEKAERPNRIFNWEEIDDDVYFKMNTTRYFGSDWGTVDPWGILEAKYYDGALYLHELNYDSENIIKGKLTESERLSISDSDSGIVKFIFKKLNIPYENDIICDTNRPLKIIGLREAGWEYAIEAIKPPGSILDGINLLSDLKVYYTSSSKNIKNEQENYSRKMDRYNVVMEEPEDCNNHLIDPARYIAQFLRKEGIISNL